ncbi:MULTISPECIES: 5-formyltetrahydrofolate cyclo-ligase [Gammaproteobacteria]|uniref:5-formyltetrahydrofolate cyclo-ligase n=1 Tax=Gammaproteobacteria TaxID=1236 RepID=UPI000DCF75C0|nr:MULTISPECIES: 5-formyltetrahydrofolate cyclo-ligase [Gammaproteobacteria]RTE85531.1 5-formyltetrahydrofolate cyclo-ligase [Aliidiomarina sp. B3213]TCZ89500.1 5-formyltetrahydrofolate cyclo-ligase [Lysobacter sp. N42]
MSQHVDFEANKLAATVGFFMEMFLSNEVIEARNTLRQQMRATRRHLPTSEQEQASIAVCQQLIDLPEYQQAQSVGAYLAAFGELDIHSLISTSWSQHKNVAVPVIDPQVQGMMEFFELRENSAMQVNQFGLSEPCPTQNSKVAPEHIELLCVPLVAFDTTGQRLGMGGGYYDRLLSRWQNGTLGNLYPVGIAHDCQFVDSLPSAPWDVPLPMIITPSKTWRF